MGKSGEDSAVIFNGAIQNGDGTAILIVREEQEPLLKRDRGEDQEKQGPLSKLAGFFFSESDDSYVDVLLASPFFLRAIKFLPALLITFGIELANSAVLGSNQDVLERHFTLVLFIPVISAIAGNIGLQTSSSVTAYINIRLVERKPVDVTFLLRKYTSHCLVQIILLSILMGILATFWQKGPCQQAYGVIILSGAAVNMTIASVAGVFTPIICNKVGYDPSSGAGPFETALQDVIGAMFFVTFAKVVLASGWPKGCNL